MLELSELYEERYAAPGKMQAAFEIVQLSRSPRIYLGGGGAHILSLRIPIDIPVSMCVLFCLFVSVTVK